MRDVAERPREQFRLAVAEEVGHATVDGAKSPVDLHDGKSSRRRLEGAAESLLAVTQSVGVALDLWLRRAVNVPLGHAIDRTVRCRHCSAMKHV